MTECSLQYLQFLRLDISRGIKIEKIECVNSYIGDSKPYMIKAKT